MLMKIGEVRFEMVYLLPRFSNWFWGMINSFKLHRNGINGPDIFDLI